MSATKHTELKCDLCGTKKIVPDGCMPSGWLVIGQENQFVDRSFYDSHVCDSCTQKIILQAAKAAKTPEGGQRPAQG